MDRNIELVDEFFNIKFAEYSRRLTLLIEKYNPTTLKERELDPEELEDLLNIMLELRSLFRNLQWYAEVNKRGFVKILKKLDKKIHVNAQSRYLNSKVLVLPFANASSVDSKLALINTFIDELTPLSADDSGNVDPNLLRSNTEKIINGPVNLQAKSELQKISAQSSSLALPDTALILRQFLNNDDSIHLQQTIEKQKPSNEVLLIVLYKAVPLKALGCIKALLSHIQSFEDPTDLNGRSLFHRIVINHARQRTNGKTIENTTTSNAGALSPANSSGFNTPNSQKQYNRSLYLNPAVLPAASANLSSAFGTDGSNSNDDSDILAFILDNTPENLRHYLVASDTFKRTPLHYSSQHGLKLLTKVIIEYTQKWDLVDPILGFAGSSWKDTEGFTPIQLSIKGNHPLTTEVILSAMNKQQISQIPDLLHIATRLGSPKLISLLLDAGYDVNKIADPTTNETALYLSAKLNFPDIAELLIKGGADTEIAESTYGWTPLFVASVEGYKDIVKLLIDNGSIIDKADSSGWTPAEHTCLRGHLDILDLLQPKTPPTDAPKLFLNDLKMVNGSDTSLSTMGANSFNSDVLGSSPTSTMSSSPESISFARGSPERSLSPVSMMNLSNEPPVKTFGHRYLKDSSMVLVNLGSMDIRETEPPIQLDRVPYSKASSTQLDTALSLIISVKNSEGEPIVIDLPINEGQTMDQYSFYTSSPETAMICFDLVPTYSGSKNKILGRAVGLLSQLTNKIGEHKVSLHRTITLPIIETQTLEILGKIRFQFLIVNPFHHPSLGVVKSSSYWKSLITTRVIGHRGLGKNSLSTKSLQLGENTLQSFIAAANLGASYVEFDVQLTKDYVPVIYHDFLVGETGIDIPMQSLTLEQFLNISDLQKQSDGRSMYHLKSSQDTDSKNKIKPSSIDDLPAVTLRSKEKNRSMSMYDTVSPFESALDRRMKYTRDFKLRGFKANTRGHSIQAPFTTLEEVLKTLPKNVGFNIECKYPMLDESQAEDMDNLAIELNFWVDTVLKTVYDHAQGRDIIFSSFHPEICIMLSMKQPSIPVLFLTEAGTAPMMDVRATSLQEAIRLARRWDLLGIVSECTPLIRCPRLIRAVKDSGIVCVTYGAMNNDPSNARLQMKYGVDAVIVDSVLAVRKGLTEPEPESTSESENSKVTTVVNGETATSKQKEITSA